jgi:hypothetical protein
LGRWWGNRVEVGREIALPPHPFSLRGLPRHLRGCAGWGLAQGMGRVVPWPPHTSPCYLTTSKDLFLVKKVFSFF